MRLAFHTTGVATLLAGLIFRTSMGAVKHGYSVTLLEDFQSGPRLYRNENNLQQINQTKQFMLTKNPAQNIHVNISQIINLFAITGCHIVVDNFQNVDIVASFASVLVRRPKLAILECNGCYRRKRLHLFWIASGNLLNQTIHVEKWYKLNCKLSKYMQGFADSMARYSTGPGGSICAQLKFLEYSFNARPWNCQVQISIQIIQKSLEMATYPWDFYFGSIIPKNDLRSPLRPEPSSVPKLHIIVHHDVSKTKDSDILKLMGQMQKLYTFREGYHMEEVFGSIVKIDTILVTIGEHRNEQVFTVRRLSRHLDRNSLEIFVNSSNFDTSTLHNNFLHSYLDENEITWCGVFS